MIDQGRVIEVRNVEVQGGARSPLPTTRIWITQDGVKELCLYTVPLKPGEGPVLGETVIVQQKRIVFDDWKKKLPLLGKGRPFAQSRGPKKEFS